MSKYYQPSGTVAEKGGPMVKYHKSGLDGSSQPYALYVPAAYDPSRKWPLVISLHGFSSDHVLNLRRVFGLGNAPGEPDTECKQVFPEFPEVDFIVASPYGFGSVGYAAMGEIDALDVLADVKERYSIDDDRVYLTGLSMGGEGTWHLALRYPHIWAAIAPVCAPTGEFIGPEDVRCFAHNAEHLPVYVSHGAADPVVPVDCSRRMVEILKGLGVQVEYEEYPGVEHNAWDYTYKDARIFDLLGRHERVRKPAHVSYVTDRLRYGRAYWVSILGMGAWDRMARVVAEVIGQSVEIKTENVTAIKLNLADAPIDLSLPVDVIWNGEKAFSGVAVDGGTVSLGELRCACELAKRKGLEGPPFDAFRSPFAIAYGTQTDDPEERNSLECLALQAAFLSDWADLEVPVIADIDVTDEQIASMNLILVGDDRTNALIGRINADLPIRFTPDGIQAGERLFPNDAGYVEVYPNPLQPDRYVIVVGGRSEEILSKVTVHTYRYMPDYAVYSAETETRDPETYLAYGYFGPKWELES